MWIYYENREFLLCLNLCIEAQILQTDLTAQICVNLHFQIQWYVAINSNLTLDMLSDVFTFFFFFLKFPKHWLSVEHVFVFVFHRKYPVYSFTFHVYISVSVHVSSHSRPVYMRLWVIGVLTLLLVTGVLRPVQSLSGPRPVGAAGRQCLSAVLDAVIQWAESTARGSHRLICCCR